MNYTIEVMRLIAVVLITFTHTRHTLESGPLYILLEEVPKYGTLLLSIISGFLFWTKSRVEPNLFEKKVKSLAIPYLSANALVLALTLLIYWILGYNYLNRLPLDYHLITEGIFSLNGAPIDPPTYFIRDIFIVFVMMDILFNKRFKLILVLLPFLIFGKLMLRFDILGLFALGILFAATYKKWGWQIFLLVFLLLSIAAIRWLPEYSKFAVSPFLFCVFISFKIPFRKTGGFTYLLHLYHSPIIVMTYPLLSQIIPNIVVCIFAQIAVALFFAGMLYQLSERWRVLKFLSGGR